MIDPTDEKAKEERALDALVAAAFDQDPCDESPAALQKYADSLTDEDRAALRDISPGLVEKLFGGKLDGASPRQPKAKCSGLISAMNRAEEDAELSEEAREEMERKVREADKRGEAKP